MHQMPILMFESKRFHARNALRQRGVRDEIKIARFVFVRRIDRDDRAAGQNRVNTGFLEFRGNDNSKFFDRRGFIDLVLHRKRSLPRRRGRFRSIGKYFSRSWADRRWISVSTSCLIDGTALFRRFHS